MCYIDTHNVMKSVCFSTRLIKHCEYNDCFASKPHNFFSKTDLIIVLYNRYHQPACVKTSVKSKDPKSVKFAISQDQTY